MIVAEQKPLAEIKTLVADAQKVLVVGCGTCVTVCFAGGEKEAGMLGSLLRMSTRLEGQSKAVTEATVQRQCEWEYLDTIADQVAKAIENSVLALLTVELSCEYVSDDAF